MCTKRGVVGTVRGVGTDAWAAALETSPAW